MRRELPPIQPYLDAIDQAKTIEELMAVQNRVYEETGGTLFMGFGLNIDVKDNTAYTLLFDGITPSLGQGGYSTATPGAEGGLSDLCPHHADFGGAE